MWGAGETPEAFIQRVTVWFKNLEVDSSEIPVDEVAQACLDGESSRISHRICRPERKLEEEEPSAGYEYKKRFYMVVFTWKACDSSSRVFRTFRLFASMPSPCKASFYLRSRMCPEKPGGIRVKAADGSYEVFRIGIYMKELVREQDDTVVRSEYIPINHRAYMGTIWTDREGEPIKVKQDVSDKEEGVYIGPEEKG